MRFLILFLFLAACGIKSKPLPPIQTTPQEVDPAVPLEKKK